MVHVISIAYYTLTRIQFCYTDNSGGEMSIPKALLNSEEDNFTVLFTVMCGGREFLLVRQLTVTLSPGIFLR